jgi:hypothetical protein
MIVTYGQGETAGDEDPRHALRVLMLKRAAKPKTNAFIADFFG